MSRVAKLFNPINTVPVPDTVNKTGFQAYSKPLKESYIQMVLTNTLGNTYYASESELLKEATEYHKKMAATDPEYMAKAIAYARNVGFMRTQPILGLVYLSEAKISKKLFVRTFNNVIRTPNDLSDFATMLSSVRKGQGGRRVRSTVAKWLTARLNEYWIVKYGAEKKNGAYSVKDMIAAFHPKGLNSDYFNYVFGNLDKVDFGKVPMFKAFETLKAASNDVDKVEAIQAGKLPHEVASSFAGTSSKVWAAIVPNMPLFATLRNLATMERHGIADNFKELIKSKLSNAENVKKAKILPFRFLSAMEKVNAPWIKDTLRKSIENAVENLPDITGSTAIIIDVSGSMQNSTMHGDGTNPSKISFMLGISLFKKANVEQVIAYSNTAFDITSEISTVDSVLTQVEKFNRSRSGWWGNTNTEKAFKALKKQKIDNIILITDEQQNAGGYAYKEYSEWKAKHNRHAKLFVINVAPYVGSGICPEDKNNYGIYGWNDNVLSFIAAATKGFSTFVDTVEQFVLPDSGTESESA